METHALPGARFVDPKVLARIKDLELLARNVVDGFINGLHRAPFFGASIDFAEHRGYVPGDDIRRVDWKLYARTDRYYVKQYEADTRLELERKQGELLDEQAKNKKKEAESDAEATAIRLAPLEDVESGKLLGAAVMEAAKSGRVGTIAITSEFLAAINQK